MSPSARRTRTAEVEARLARMGLAVPKAATPLATYRPAVRSGPYVYVAGQLPTRDGAMVHPGRVGVNVSVEEGREAARVAALNALGAAKPVAGSLDALRVVRVVGYVACSDQFADHPAVVEGASLLLKDAFGEERGVGARLALGVSSLPAQAAVEIEVLFEVLE
jgi:enamine deaminase RidA (YjgF/YER057c/UK114 family)